METDTGKIDGAVLALLQLTLHDGRRAWKTFDWDVMDRLYRKGMIEDPVNKTKSVVLSEDGGKRMTAGGNSSSSRCLTTGRLFLILCVPDMNHRRRRWLGSVATRV